MIVAIGMPGAQGSKKYVGKSKAGNAIMVESSKKVKPWRADVKRAAQAALNGAQMFDCPVRVRMIFTMPKPASASKRKRILPSGRPDLSKLARSTEDAITDAGVWRDDARIVEYARLAKVYPSEDPESLKYPGVIVKIEEIIL